MNILFYLVPKSEVMYLYDDYSLATGDGENGISQVQCGADH